MEHRYHTVPGSVPLSIAVPYRSFMECTGCGNNTEIEPLRCVSQTAQRNKPQPAKPYRPKPFRPSMTTPKPLPRAVLLNPRANGAKPTATARMPSPKPFTGLWCLTRRNSLLRVSIALPQPVFWGGFYPVLGLKTGGRIWFCKTKPYSSTESMGYVVTIIFRLWFWPKKLGLAKPTLGRSLTVSSTALS